MEYDSWLTPIYSVLQKQNLAIIHYNLFCTKIYNSKFMIIYMYTHSKVLLRSQKQNL